MVSSAALFTENVYKPAVPGRTERHYVWIGRLTSVMVVAGGVVFALWVPTVVKALEIWFMIAPMMGLVFWIGLLWRRLTVVGAWITTLSGFATWWITTQSWFIDWVARLPIAEAWRLLWVENGKTSLYLPWQILLYMTVAVAAGVVVSLFTRPVSQDKLDRFYTLSRTPIAPGEQLVEPCVLPPSTAAAKRTMLVTF
jgi:Na+/proline symporter